MLVLSRKIGERIVVPHCELAVRHRGGRQSRTAGHLRPGRHCRVPGRSLAATLPANARPASERVGNAGGERDYRPGKSSGSPSGALALLHSEKGPEREQSYNGATLHE